MSMIRMQGSDCARYDLYKYIYNTIGFFEDCQQKCEQESLQSNRETTLDWFEIGNYIALPISPVVPPWGDFCAGWYWAGRQQAGGDLPLRQAESAGKP